MFTPIIPGAVSEQPIVPEPSDVPTDAAESEYCRLHGVRADEHVGGCA
jgi:hypothetical protein